MKFILEVIFIKKIERDIDIIAPINKVFDVLNDPHIGVTWSIATKEITELEPGKYSAKTTVGDFISTRIETIENEKLSMKIEGGIFTAYGYVLKSKGDITNVVMWGEFDDEKQEKILLKAGELTLKSLKTFVEYLEEGGDPNEYDKKQITVAP